MRRFLDTYFPPVEDAAGRESTLLRVHHALFFVLLVILVGSQVVSKFMMSGMQILLIINWLLELCAICILRKRAKPNNQSTNQPIKQSSIFLLYAFLVMIGVHVVWLLGTSNMDYAMDDLFRKLPLLAIPVVVIASRPLNKKQFQFTLFFFVGTVFVATIIGVVRLLTIPDLPYREIVPFISHIRFSLNICIAIVLLLWYLVTNIQNDKLSVQNSKFKIHYLTILLIVWFVLFLFVLRSYTAFFVLFVSAWLLLIVYWSKMGNRRRWCLMAMLALTIAVAVTSASYVRSYYGGNFAQARQGLVENGHLINDNINRPELFRQWSNYSKLGIDDTVPNGNSVYLTLIRYMNAKGLTKDSVGLLQLTPYDIELIEKGIANPVQVEGPAVKNMFYTLLYEYENYRVFGNIRNSSMLERVALWRGAWRVFCDKPLFGVGTGDCVDELHYQLQADDSQIADTEKHAHNQYLSFLVAFGIVGFLLIAFAFIYAFRRLRLLSNPAFFAIILIILLSFISEDTVETLAGCVLATVLPCLFAKCTTTISSKTD